MTRKSLRRIAGAAVGLIAGTTLAAGTAQAGIVPALPAVGGLVPAGLTQALPVGAVTGILPAGQ